jgi:hypothetical protein
MRHSKIEDDMRLLENVKNFILIVFAMSASAAVASDRPVLNDWFALGSGCRARSDLPGNVHMKRLPEVGGLNGVYAARFQFDNFRIEEERFPEKLKQVGRECAVRLNINPPQGKRILSIRAHTTVSVSKSPGHSLDLLAELKLGAESLGQDSQKIAATDTRKSAIRAIRFEAGQGYATPLPQLGCGEPKIIGFDYSWIVSRGQGSSIAATVELGSENALVIEAELGDCG